MAYRNKTYVCFDGDTDMHYYRLMCAWKQNDSSTFTFYNAHDLNTARDSSQEESIKRQLRERLLNTKIFVVLIGESTRHLHKFVRWEIEQAISLGLPIIAVNLNGETKCDNTLCPKIIRDTLSLHIPFKSKLLQYALENWPESHRIYKAKTESGTYHYKDSVYEQLGVAVA